MHARSRCLDRVEAEQAIGLGALTRFSRWTLRVSSGILGVWSPHVRGFAALGSGAGMWGGGDEMTEKSERRLFGRQRRANVDVPRDRRYTVKVNAEEDAQLRARAVVAGVTVSRLMFESAMNAHIETDTARQEVIAEFFAVRRLMANAANNVNQLAKYANTESVFPQDAEAIVAEYRAIVPRLSDALDRLSES